MMPSDIFVKANMTELFEALSDRTRLRILNLLALGDICVCYFTELLDAPQPTVSRHLAYLRRAGLVDARREGKWMHYSLARPTDPSAARVLDAVLTELKHDREMQRDIKALQSACCAVRLPAALADAPRPSLR